MALDLAALTSRLDALEREHERTLTDIQRLKDIEDIRLLKHRYFRGLDSADLELLSAQLAEDFNVHFRSDVSEVVCRNRAEFVERMSKVFNNQMATQHQGHHPEITIDADGKGASGIWYLQDIVHDLHNKTIMAGTNFYQDRYVKTAEEGWRLQSSKWDRHIEVRHKMDFAVNYTGRYLKDHGRDLPGYAAVGPVET